MNCAYHVNEVAVAQCVDCGRGLCKECAAKFNVAICETCYEARIENDKRQFEEDKREQKYQARMLFWGRAIWGLIFAIAILLFIGLGEYNSFKESDYNDVFSYVADGFKGFTYTEMEEDPENPGVMIEVEKTHSFFDYIFPIIMSFGIPFGWHAVNWFKRQRTEADYVVDAVYSATNGLYVFFSMFIFIFKIIAAIMIGWILAAVYFIVMSIKVAKIERMKYQQG